MSVQQQIAAAAARLGVPVNLALAVARRESEFDQGARGKAGEVGVFQLMPGTAAELGVNPYDLGQNIDGGLRYLKQQFDRFGDWTTALWAYNAGPGRVTRDEVPASTRAYADDILGWAGPLQAAAAVVWPSLTRPGLQLELESRLPSPAVPWLALAAGAGVAWLLLRR